MSGQITEEVIFLLHSFLLGIVITFVYDLFRIFRRVIRHGILWISLEDLFFWILTAVGIFYLLHYENNGAFRWFAILGAGVGMFLYKKTLSEPLVQLVSKLVNRLLGLGVRILRRLLAPFRALFRRLGIWAGRFTRRVKRELRIRRRAINYRLTAWRKVFKIKLKQFRLKLKKVKEN